MEAGGWPPGGVGVGSTPAGAVGVARACWLTWAETGRRACRERAANKRMPAMKKNEERFINAVRLSVNWHLAHA